MKNMNLAWTLAAALIALAARPEDTFAQQRPDWASMDPQQIQQMIEQRLMDNCREQLAITNDAEWGVIEERLSKVVHARLEILAASLGMGGGMRLGGGGGGNGPGGGFRGFGQASVETEALRSAVDAHAPASQIKAALGKYRQAQKLKQAELTKAQEELRQVISIRQEAVLVSMSLLD
jgi:hypothetical protein